MAKVSLDRRPLEEANTQENIQLRRTVTNLEQLLRETNEQHRVIVTKLEGRITQLEMENTELRATVAALLARINKSDPQLSSNPPSSVAPRQRYPKKVPTGRPVGKPKGATGATALFSEYPDRVLEYRPSTCAHGHTLASVHEVEARQVRDLDVRVVITEHRVFEGNCETCDEVVRSSFPGEVTSRVVWGDSVKAFALLLTQRSLLPDQASAELLAALGLPVSTTCLTNWRHSTADLLSARFTPALRAALLASPHLCVDETPLNITNGETYAHVATNGPLVHYHLGGRGLGSMTDGAIIGHYPGPAVHDHYSAYFCEATRITAHQLCVAHLRRELKLVTQNFEPTDDRVHPQPWAREMTVLLGRAITERPSITSVRTEYRRLARQGCRGQKPDAKQPIERDAWNLARRLLDHEASVLRFLTREGRAHAVPPTNNAAEQSVKPIKVRQRRSGCFRTSAGARDFLVLQSYLRSAVGSGVEPLAALRRVLTGDPWIPPAN